MNNNKVAVMCENLEPYYLLIGKATVKALPYVIAVARWCYEQIKNGNISENGIRVPTGNNNDKVFVTWETVEKVYNYFKHFISTQKSSALPTVQE